MVKKPYPLSALEQVRKEATDRAVETLASAHGEARARDHARKRAEEAKIAHVGETEKVVTHEDERLEEGLATVKELTELAQFRARRSLEQEILGSELERKEHASEEARREVARAQGDLGARFAERELVARHHARFSVEEKREELNQEEIENEDIKR